MNKIRIAYFGSSDFSANFLEKLIGDPTSPSGLQGASQLVEVKFVVTQPDRPVGRKQILTPTPVKVIAEKYKIKSKILNSKRLEFGASNLFGTCNLEFSALKNFDLALVYAFGVIIPQELLNLPKYGFWCLHPSLLPKYRGTSPMATALINGDKETGVTIIKMDERIDHGPIIVQEKYTILPTDRRPDLEKKLTDLGFQLFVQSINRLDNIKFQNQDHSKASYTKKLTKRNGFISFENWKLKIENSPEILYNLFRGLYPWPGIWTLLPNNKRLKITELNMVRNRHACSLQIKRVQLEGKKEVDFETFKKAYKLDL